MEVRLDMKKCAGVKLAHFCMHYNIYVIIESVRDLNNVGFPAYLQR